MGTSSSHLRRELRKYREENAKLREERSTKNEEEALNEFERNYTKILNEACNEMLRGFDTYARGYVVQNNGRLKSQLIATTAKSVFTDAQIYEYIFNFIQDQVREKAETATRKLDHFNVIVCGKTGVGKSTLINSMLKLEESKKAETGYGKPITQRINNYQSEKERRVKIWDTRGIELDGYGPSEVVADIKKIVDRCSSGDPENYIHAVWYCVVCGGNRIEDVEMESIEKLKKIYPDSKLPVIIVLTQAYFQEDKAKMMNFIINECKVDKNSVLPLVSEAKKGTDTKSYGLNELLRLTGEKARDATKSAFWYSVENQVNDILEKLSKDLEVKSMKNSAGYINNFINNIKQDIEPERLIICIKNVLSTILKVYISTNNESEQKVSQSIYNDLNKLIDNLQNDIMSLVDNGIEEYFKKCPSDLITKCYNEKNRIESAKSVNLKFPNFEEKVRLDIMDRCLNRTQVIMIKHISIYLSGVFTEHMSQTFRNQFPSAKRMAKNYSISIINKCINDQTNFVARNEEK